MRNIPQKLREFIAFHMTAESAELVHDITTQMMADPKKEITQWVTMAA